MESLERFQQSRAVIEDFSSTTLADIPSDFGRLCYISYARPHDPRTLKPGFEGCITFPRSVTLPNNSTTGCHTSTLKVPHPYSRVRGQAIGI
jgi:hypothetical protein